MKVDAFEYMFDPLDRMVRSLLDYWYANRAYSPIAFFCGKIMEEEKNIVRIGLHVFHKIKAKDNAAVPLSEFVELATPFVSLFHQDFAPWIERLEHDKIIRSWSKSSREQKERIISEYFRFFFE